MKKLILIICLFIGTNNFSQNYQSLFDSISTTWDNLDFTNCDGSLNEHITAIIDDTVINLNTYKILTNTIGETYGFIREDTVLGKAWFYDIEIDTEFLVMNLSLTIGQTFDLIDYDINFVHPCIVDSVFYLDGRKNVRIEAVSDICFDQEKITFIEGIGTTAGFKYQNRFGGTTVYAYQLCQHKSGIQVFSNKMFNGDCTIGEGGGIDEFSSKFDFQLYPNPSSDLITINSQQSGDYFITDALGSIVSTGKIIADQSLEISTLALSKGMYQVIIVTENKQKSIQKLVIK